MSQLAPWQVWWVDFDPQLGHEQAGRRPGIVVGSRYACGLPNNLAIVVPCTRTDRRLPVQPAVSLDGVTGFAMCDQVKAVDLVRLRKRHPGSLTKAEIETVKFALRRIIDIA